MGGVQAEACAAQRRGRRRLPETSDPTATASSKSSSGRSAIGCGLRRWGSHDGGAAAAAAVLVVVVMVVIVASVTISGAIYRVLELSARTSPNDSSTHVRCTGNSCHL